MSINCCLLVHFVFTVNTDEPRDANKKVGSVSGSHPASSSQSAGKDITDDEHRVTGDTRTVVLSGDIYFVGTVTHYTEQKTRTSV